MKKVRIHRICSFQGVIMKTEIMKTEREDNWENANQEVTFANLSFLNENYIEIYK